MQIESLWHISSKNYTNSRTFLSFLKTISHLFQDLLIGAQLQKRRAIVQ